MPPVAISSPKPLRADARRNREKVLEAARTVFAECGREAQVDDVARRAGVGVGTVYRHFENKEGLLEQLAVSRFEQFAERAEAGAAAVAAGTSSAWDAFAGLLEHNGALLARDAAIQQALGMAITPPDAAAPALDRLHAATEVLLGHLRGGGLVRADLAVMDVAHVMCGLGALMAMHGEAAWDWRRHLGIWLDGVRTAPPPRG